MNWTRNADRMRPAALVAALAWFLCLSATGLCAQNRGQSHQAAPMRTHPAPNMPRTGGRMLQNPQRGAQNRPRQGLGQPLFQNPQGRIQNLPQNGEQRFAPELPSGSLHGAQNSQFSRPNDSNAPHIGGFYPGDSQPGHLGDWLNRHPGLPLPKQEQLLRSDPSFNRLAPATQQRLVQQLHQLDKMPQAQRERRLARSEMLERMSPQQQMQVRQAGRRFEALPADRQAKVKQAFRDLRSVPLDQRDTVLNSQRYQNLFTPDERGILSNLLRAEPYEPAR